MIIGQPGSGKSTLTVALGQVTFLPVFHIDHIHWKSGWVERTGPEKDALCHKVHARERWIFEGCRAATWADRLDRADTLIWLDFALGLRAWRVAKRTIRYLGRTRPDLPPGCPERFSLEFYRWIWNTRHSSRERMRELFNSASKTKTKYHFRSGHEVAEFLSDLRRAVAVGNLGIPHR